MYTVEEIMKMLDTKSQEEVVKEFTTALNAAAKRKAEEAKTVTKTKEADEVMHTLMSFLAKYYPEWGKTSLTGKDLVKILDNTKFFSHEFKMPSLDPLSNFLKEHKL